MKNQGIIWDEFYRKGLRWKKKTVGIEKIINNKSVLELGVGNGKTLKAILEQKPEKVVAIDISQMAIKTCLESIKSDKISYIIQDFLNAKFKDKFDVIICYYFLNNLKEKQRKKVVRKIISILDKNGVILFEDFAVGDLREKGKIVENNTIQKQNGLICHFFDKEEIKELFKDFNFEIKEKTFIPIRKNKGIERKIIKAVIRTR